MKTKLEEIQEQHESNIQTEAENKFDEIVKNKFEEVKQEAHEIYWEEYHSNSDMENLNLPKVEVNGVFRAINEYTEKVKNGELENIGAEKVTTILNKNLREEGKLEYLDFNLEKAVKEEFELNKIEIEPSSKEYSTEEVEEIHNALEDINVEEFDKSEEKPVEEVKIEKIEENPDEEDKKEDKQSLIENIAEDAFSELTEGLKNSENILDAATGEMYDRWREEYLEEKEAEKKQEEIEEAFDKDEQNEQEADKNIEEKAQEEGQKEQQNKGEFAEAQAKEAVESIEIDAGMSM